MRVQLWLADLEHCHCLFTVVMRRPKLICQLLKCKTFPNCAPRPRSTIYTLVCVSGDCPKVAFSPTQHYRWEGHSMV